MEKFNHLHSHVDTFTGRTVSVLEPKADQFNINDIAMALSRLCRFGGHCRSFYSVAQHSVLCLKLFQSKEYWSHLRKWYMADHNPTYEHEDIILELAEYQGPTICMKILLHDAAEAYMQDLIRPVKQYCPDYEKLLDNMQTQIELAWGLPIHNSPIVKLVDNAILAAERRDLLNDVSWKCELPPSQGIPPINPLEPADAHILFLDNYYRLFAGSWKAQTVCPS